MDNLITIIVPVYKVEQYLNRCIESLINQTHQNLEIILVNDGSPDNSGKICDLWAGKDERIKVIHTDNRGAGAARNIALSCAKGDYIGFVDSDDYIALEMYELLLGLFNLDNTVDITECEHIITKDDYIKFDDNNDISNEGIYSCEQALGENIDDHYFRQLIWNKLYKRKVVEGIWFPEGKKIDDEFWTYQVIGRAKKLIHSDRKLYAYRQQANSVMHCLTADARLQAVEAKIERHNYVCKYFPKLKSKSLVNLWFTCIYQAQMARKIMIRIEYKRISYVVQEILRLYPLKFKELRELSAKQKMWLILASISMDFTCVLRNTLKIGI